METEVINYKALGDMNVRLLPFYDRHIIGEVLSGVYHIDGVTDPKLIVDLGSHIGTFSVLSANKWPDAKIITVEPRIDNYELTGINVGRFPQITAIHAAIGLYPNETYRYQAYQDVNNTGAGYVVLDPGGDIKSVLLSDIIEEHGDIDLLKSDCEGGEWAWMEDVDRFDVAHRIKIIVGECHGNDWLGRITKYLGRTHAIESRFVNPEVTKALGYFTATLKPVN